MERVFQGIKMETKQQFLEEINKVKGSKRDYLNKLFQYVSEAVIRAAVHKNVKKDEFIIRAGEPCDTVYIILKGDVAGVDYQKLGKVYYFMDFAKMYIVVDFEIFSEDTNYNVSICASKDSELLAIPASIYWKWIKHDENALLLRIKNIMTILTSEKASDRKYMFMSCKERLMKYLIISYGCKRGKQVGTLRLKKTQAELSERIGFNVRSVQRSIAALEKEKLIYTSNTDELTRCLNRHAYENDMKKLNLSEEWVYISVDLNGLKRANDSYGHMAGDELICAAADCMRDSFHEYGKVYRIGGDEFAVIITENPNQVEELIHSFDSNVANWHGKFVNSMTVSYGWVFSTERNWGSAYEISKAADARMYQSKERYYKESGADRR